MDTNTSFAKKQLRSLIERIERLEEEKKAIAADIKDVYGEAKANGFDSKVMRKVVALRKLDPAGRQEQEAILDLYLSALGMQLSMDFDGDGDDQPADDKPAKARKTKKPAPSKEAVPA